MPQDRICICKSDERERCVYLQVGEALVAEVAKGRAGTAPHIIKSPSAYIQQLIGESLSHSVSGHVPVRV